MFRFTEHKPVLVNELLNQRRSMSHRDVCRFPRTLRGIAGHRDVYAYRFDWDEQGTIGSVDMSLALGAGHSVELPFVFGTPDSLVVPLGDPDAPGRRALSASMMSYWAEHAYTGSPGRGRAGHEPAWTPWRDAEGEHKLIIFDTAADGGIRMSSDRITHAALKQAVLEERGFVSTELHARLYRGLFERRKPGLHASRFQRVPSR